MLWLVLGSLLLQTFDFSAVLFSDIPSAAFDQALDPDGDDTKVKMFSVPEPVLGHGIVTTLTRGLFQCLTYSAPCLVFSSIKRYQLLSTYRI
jgi:hypothetical protein